MDKNTEWKFDVEAYERYTKMFSMLNLVKSPQRTVFASMANQIAAKYPNAGLNTVGEQK